MARFIGKAMQAGTAWLLVLAGWLLVSGQSALAAPQVAAGPENTCRIRTDGTLACWGNDYLDQTSPPAGTFIAVSASYRHACAVRSDGTLACWGADDFGAPPAGTFTTVSAGWTHDCALRTDGTLACWGWDQDGMFPPPAGTFIDVSPGAYHTCAVRTDGTLACWGFDNYGQLIPPAGTFTDVAGKMFHNCAVRTDGTLACWGYNDSGQANPPTGTFASVDTDQDYSCGLRTDQTLTCWGGGELAQRTPPAGAFSEFSSNRSHSCALRADGTMACWGWGGYGAAPAPELRPLAMPDANVGAGQSVAFSLVDVGPGILWPYPFPMSAFAVIDGALPPGLGLSAAGLLSGTPTAIGDFDFIVEGEDANGFTAQRSYSMAVGEALDDTPPSIAPTLAGTPGDNGWYTSDVTVGWSVVDDGSAIASSAGCGTTTLTVDSAGTVFQCTATSAGGTASASITLRRDTAPPTLAPTLAPAVLLLNGDGTASANASDALSGVATQHCTALDTASVGTHAATCTATDVAGNTANASVAYTVIYGFVGFSAPLDNPPQVNLARAGQTIALKWRVVDADGAPVAGLAGPTLSAIVMTCDGGTTDEVEQYVAGGSGFHDHGNGDYQYNWQAPKSYQDSCRMLVLDLGDGRPRVALFRFR